MISINYRDSKPIYEQIIDSYKRMILSGVIQADYKMPSVRELANQLTINPNTIQRAYRELEAEGYIFAVPGKGSFVCNIEQSVKLRKAELLLKLQELSEELLSLGATEEELQSAIKRRELK